MGSLDSSMSYSCQLDQKNLWALISFGMKLNLSSKELLTSSEKDGSWTKGMVHFMDLKLTSLSTMCWADRNNVARFSWTFSFQSDLTYSIPQQTKLHKTIMIGSNLQSFWRLAGSIPMSIRVSHSYGRKNPLSQNTRGQSWSIERFWGQLKDSWPYWLSISAVDGLFGSLLAK